MNQLPDERIYYAQNREDLILEAFFPDVKKGFYVDVGACHPYVASVTKRFYLKGWRGINIEPQKELCHLFDLERARDININCGVSDEETKVVLRTYINNRGLSTVAADMKDSYKDGKGDKTEKYEDIPMKTKTLRGILQEHNVQSIQFLKIDVEGYEYEVLKGNDWQKFRPEVLCIESNHIIKDWRHLLIEQGYNLAFFDGLNEYYADNNTDRADKFDYVGHIVMGLKGGIAADDYEKIAELQSLKAENEKTLQEMQRTLQSTRDLAKITVKLLPSRLKHKLGMAKRR